MSADIRELSHGFYLEANYQGQFGLCKTRQNWWLKHKSGKVIWGLLKGQPGAWFKSIKEAKARVDKWVADAMIVTEVGFPYNIRDDYLEWLIKIFGDKAIAAKAELKRIRDREAKKEAVSSAIKKELFDFQVRVNAALLNAGFTDKEVLRIRVIPLRDIDEEAA